MKDSELQFDRTCHVLYTKPCKKQIQAKIALHYPPERREEVWTRVQRQYADFLSDWRTDLGGKKNFHNGRGGNYDCIALMAYYVVCRDATNLAEIEEMEGALFLPAFRKLRFVNCNRPFFKKLLYRAFCNAKKHGLLEVMPALCNPDFAGMELIHARLVRRTTCANGCRCDYTICGDCDEYLNAHPEYRDEAGYRRNR